jgi:predicted enzyme related to lactoylglutathione lyase
MGQEKAQAKVPVALQSLSWLAGSWISTSEGIETDETWMSPKSGLMLGTNRTVRPNGKTAFEFMRLVQEEDRITLYASPSGKPATPFALKKLTAAQVVFENLDNDFPHRVIYQRDQNKDQLHARIEGTIDGVERSMEWHWKRHPSPDSQPAAKSDPKQPSFQGLRTAVYKVKDLNAAKKWYASALGIEPYFDQPFYVGFNIGGFELGLDPDMKGVTPGNNHVAYWGVEDCEASYQRLLKMGAREQQKPQSVGDGVTVATVIDPFGNHLGIIQNPGCKIK